MRNTIARPYHTDWTSVVGKWTSAALAWTIFTSALLVTPACAQMLLSRRVPDYSAAFHSAGLQLHIAPSREGPLLFVDRPGRPRVTLTLAASVSDIPATFQMASGGRAVVMIDNGGGAIYVSIVDVVNPRIVDQFYCYQPVVSPDGNYMAMKQFYPEHDVTAEQSSSFLNVYDLAPTSVVPSAAHAGVADLVTRRGELVYPARQELSMSRRYGLLIIHQIPTPVIWSKDSTKFVFIDSIFPADPIWSVTRENGNLLPSAAGPPPAAARLILVQRDGRKWRVRQYDTGVCAANSSFCYTDLLSAEFTGTGVMVDVGKPLTIPYSAFVPVREGH